MTTSKESNQQVDYKFTSLEVPITKELSKRRTLESDKKLTKLFAPIWTVYINYWLYYFHITDSHPERGDIFGDTFCHCVDTLTKVEEINFNRVKRYYNKSIEGWIRNRLYKTQKRKIETIPGEELFKILPDKNKDIQELEFNRDMKKVVTYFEKQRIIFTEIYYTIFQDRAKEDYDRAQTRYKNAVCEMYLDSGLLLSAEEYLNKRIGFVFGGTV